MAAQHPHASLDIHMKSRAGSFIQHHEDWTISLDQAPFEVGGDFGIGPRRDELNDTFDAHLPPAGRPGLTGIGRSVLMPAF